MLFLKEELQSLQEAFSKGDLLHDKVSADVVVGRCMAINELLNLDWQTLTGIEEEEYAE